ncbi:MAG TPA: alpha/beta fold hydrolase [Gemmatimonadales bacterium]|jgi:hypothetical protein|nr:alpha/beta fold hydrolase [Gemmatimonadales bacterium]
MSIVRYRIASLAIAGALCLGLSARGAEDVAATQRVLTRRKGPCSLVAHSYGGSVISEAGTDPHVAGLVYIAAHMPDAGESAARADRPHDQRTGRDYGSWVEVTGGLAPGASVVLNPTDDLKPGQQVRVAAK